MLTTINYAYKKRELTDSPPDITATEDNWDKLDTQLKLLEAAATWDGLPGKPLAYPPSAHEHPVSEIKGLPTSYPANGGNADTVDGKHATDFRPSTWIPTKADIGLGNVSNVAQMPLAGGTFTGVAKAQANTSYTTPQLRNVTISTGTPSGGGNGDIWIQY